MSSKRKSNNGSVAAGGDLDDPAAKRRKLPSVSNYSYVVAPSASVEKSFVKSFVLWWAIGGAGLVAGLAIQSAHRNTSLNLAGFGTLRPASMRASNANNRQRG